MGPPRATAMGGPAGRSPPVNEVAHAIWQAALV